VGWGGWFTHTFLSLIADRACETLGTEAVKVTVLIAQAGPTIQAYVGVTEVTCNSNPDSIIPSRLGPSYPGKSHVVLVGKKKVGQQMTKRRHVPWQQPAPGHLRMLG
jgi:hypothetical protein